MNKEIKTYMFAAVAGVCLNLFVVTGVDWSIGCALVFTIMAVKT